MRSLHLRSKVPFSKDAFEAFAASVELLEAYTTKLLEVCDRFPTGRGMKGLSYVFSKPYLSQDGCVASVDISGEWSHVSRHLIEVECAIFLWRWLPYDVIDGLEHGWTHDGQTSWKPIHSGVTHAHLDPEERKRMARVLGR